jgi:hypothetical protein
LVCVSQLIDRTKLLRTYEELKFRARIAGRRNSESLRVKPRQLFSECGGWNPE